MIAVLLRAAKAGLHLSLIRRPDLLIIKCQPLAMDLNVGYVVACKRGGWFWRQAGTLACRLGWLGGDNSLYDAGRAKSAAKRQIVHTAVRHNSANRSLQHWLHAFYPDSPWWSPLPMCTMTAKRLYIVSTSGQSSLVLQSFNWKGKTTRYISLRNLHTAGKQTLKACTASTQQEYTRLTSLRTAGTQRLEGLHSLNSD